MTQERTCVSHAALATKERLICIGSQGREKEARSSLMPGYAIELTLLQVIRTQLPQLIHLCALARHNALRNLNCTAQYVTIRNRIGRCLR